MKCWHCGEGEFVWQNDFSYDEWFANDSGDGIVSTFACSNCRAYAEVYLPLDDKE